MPQNHPAASASAAADANAQAAALAARKRNAAESLLTVGGVRSAIKRGRPTSRALPPNVANHVPESALYADLLRVERSLDWVVCRKRAELSDALTRPARVKRTLRIFLSNTCANQPWQKEEEEEKRRKGQRDKAKDGKDDAAPPTATAEDKPKDGEADKAHVDQRTGDGDGGAASSADATGADEPPSWTLRVEGRMLDPAFKSRATSAQAAYSASSRIGQYRFSNLVRSCIVELQRDPSLYPAGENVVEWQRPVPTAVPASASASGPSAHHQGDAPLVASAEPALDGFEVRRTGDVPVKVRVALYLAHTPERFSLSPELAALLDVREETRAGVVSALWAYVKEHGLLDERDRRMVRCDDALRAILRADVVALHHLPEVMNRHLHPPPPVVLEYWVRTDVREHRHPTAYDVELDLEDLAYRREREAVLEAFEPRGEKAAEVAELDDRIAQATAALHSRSLARDFLAAFSLDPHAHLRAWMASQARDLDAVLGGAGGAGASAVAGLGAEELRRAETFRAPWVAEAVAVHDAVCIAQRLQELQAAPRDAVIGGGGGGGGGPGALPGGGAAAAAAAAVTPR